MDISIKVDKQQLMGRWVVRFWTVVPEGTSPDVIATAPKIAMNRKHNGCHTAITNLQAHNNHTPPWDTEAEADSYIVRVQTDADAAMTEWEATLTPIPEQILDAFKKEDTTDDNAEGGEESSN